MAVVRPHVKKVKKDSKSYSNGQRKTYVIMGADFETDMLPDFSEGWVAQWAVVRAPDVWTDELKYTEVHGYKLSEFREYILSLMENTQMNYTIYFHNLYYDVQWMWTFIHELMEICKGDKSYRPPVVRKGHPIMMRFRNIEFRDSARKMPAGTSVKQMGEMLGLPKLESPRGNFEPGWSKDLADEDFEYVIHDAAIPALMMRKMHSQGANHATTSGDAWASGMTIFNKNHEGRSPFNDYFPELTLAEYKKFHNAYQGGLNISYHKGINRGKPIVHVDRNSMYPSILAGVPSLGVVPLLPYGKAHHLKEGETPASAGYDLYLIQATFKLTLKSGMIPIFHFKDIMKARMEGLNSTTDFVSNFSCWHKLILCSTDFENLHRFYDVQIKPGASVDYWCFESKAGLFKDYVDYWYKIKSEAPKDSVERLLAKLMLNSYYGRFGMSPYQDRFELIYDPEISDYRAKCRRPEDDEIDEIPGYLPVAIWVCAWARWSLCDVILTVGCSNVIHCDTDSVVYFGDIHDTDILGHTDALGDWKDDYPGMKWMIEAGTKRYIEFTCDGMPDSMSDFRFTCASVTQRMKNGCPEGMWLEILDEPMRLCADGLVLGQQHYKVESEWLRRILIEHGHNPDDMNTMKSGPTQLGRIKGGIRFMETTFTMHDNMITGFR